MRWSRQASSGCGDSSSPIPVEIPERPIGVGILRADPSTQILKMLDEDRVEVGDRCWLLVVQRAHGSRPIGAIVFRLTSSSALSGERVPYLFAIGGV
jgi:hypothetical protein